MAKHEEHQNLIREIISRMPHDDDFSDLAELFKIFGDTTRLKMICALFHRELNVCCIAEAAGISPSAASHQLRLLKTVRLVSSRKAGKEVYYRLSDDHIHMLYKIGFEHIGERSA